MLPKNCIKCEKSEDEIINYYYTRTFGELRDLQTTVGIYIPVCESCAKKFDKYRKQKHYLTNIISTFICLMILTSYWGSIWYLHPEYKNLAFIPILLSIMCATIMISLSIPIIRSPDRTSRYFKLQKNGKLIIKNEEYLNNLESEIKEHLKEEIRLRSQETSYFKCPKCDALQLINQDFCNSCGKDLRILKN